MQLNERIVRQGDGCGITCQLDRPEIAERRECDAVTAGRHRGRDYASDRNDTRGVEVVCPPLVVISIEADVSRELDDERGTGLEVKTLELAVRRVQQFIWSDPGSAKGKNILLTVAQSVDRSGFARRQLRGVDDLQTTFDTFEHVEREAGAVGTP